jgi:hypothetical protein
MNMPRYRKFGIGDKFTLHVYDGKILQLVYHCCLEYRYRKLILKAYGITEHKIYSEISIDKRFYNMLRNNDEVLHNTSEYMTRSMLYRLFMHNMIYTTTTTSRYRNIWYLRGRRNQYKLIELIKQ